MIYISQKEEDTMVLGERFGRLLEKGAIICLKGDLGAGKTVFTKGIAMALNIPNTQVNSPTYVILNIYQGTHRVYHFDFYRLEGMDEMSTTGYDEFLYGDGISVIEWPEKLQDCFPKEYLMVDIQHQGDNERKITILAKGGDRYKGLMDQLI